MQITFLVGNGFDKAMGLKTSYEDFYQWYVGQHNDDIDIKNLQDELESYLKDKRDNKDVKREINWSDCEVAFGLYSKRFDNIEKYIWVYENIVHSLIEYLTKEEESFKEKINQISFDKVWSKTKLFYNGLPEKEEEDFHNFFKSYSSTVKLKFVSFNYTNCLDQFVTMMYVNGARKEAIYPTKKWSLDKKVLHVNGTVERFPIFGLNDRSQIANKDFSEAEELEKIILKSECVKSVKGISYNTLEREIKNSSMICIFGMSLGETDKRWWDLILEWLKEKEDRELLIFTYAENVKMPELAHEYSRYEAEQKNGILRYLDEDGKHLQDRVHIIRNSKSIFYFDD